MYDDEHHSLYPTCEDMDSPSPHRSFWNPYDGPDLNPAQSRLAELNHKCETLEHANTELEQKIEAVAHKLATYTKQHSQLEKAFDTLRTAYTRDRSATTTNIHGLHLQLAREHRAVIEQRLNSLARHILNIGGHQTAVQSRHQVAKTIAHLSMLLFPHGPVSIEHGPSVPPDTFPTAARPRISQEMATAEALHRRITALNSAQNRVRFDYAFVADTAVDPASQEPWPSCDRDAPVVFVLAPAYIVGDDIYQRQLVYTRSQPDRGRQRRRRSRP